MSAKTWALALGLAISVSAPLAHASDHKDGTAVIADPSTDIGDIYGWMQADTNRVFLVMTVNPQATNASRFSDKALYVFHTNNRANSADVDGAETNILCRFNGSQSPQQVECWAGNDEYVKGDASTTTGISSLSGKLRVFAGLRNDPFFFNLDGFNAAATLIKNGYAGFTKDAAQCPNIPAATRMNVLTQLNTNCRAAMAPKPATCDSFFEQNILAIVVSVDRNLLTVNGTRPILRVWGSTNKRL